MTCVCEVVVDNHALHYTAQLLLSGGVVGEELKCLCHTAVH